MIILCDLDNVLCCLQEYTIEMYNKKYGTNYTLEDFKEHDVTDTLGIEGAAKMKEIYADAEIYNYLTPISGSRSAMQKFINAGHQVYIVTDAIPCTFEKKVNWIKNYFPFIDESHIVSMKHKWLFKCDVMIEDNLENLISGHHYERVCMDYPWNRGVHDEVYDIHRCYSWDDIVAAVNNINEEMGSI